jgi:predicted GIY-YIG superfamily endonuclease
MNAFQKILGVFVETVGPELSKHRNIFPCQDKSYLNGRISLSICMEATEERNHALYTLIHPDTNEPFYVGITNNPKRRMREHWKNRSRKKGHNPKKHKVIEDLKSRNLRFEMQILESGLSEAEALRLESARIKEMKDRYRLVNISVLSSFGPNADPQWRERFEAGMRKRYGEDWQPKKKKPRKTRADYFQPVIRIEADGTETRYPSMRIAGDANGFGSKNGIFQAVKTGCRAGGFHWKKAT